MSKVREVLAEVVARAAACRRPKPSPISPSQMWQISIGPGKPRRGFGAIEHRYRQLLIETSR